MAVGDMGSQMVMNKQRERRLDRRVPSWWARLDSFCDRQELTDLQRDELLDIVFSAIQEDKAAELGSLGGLKGGKALAERSTPEERSARASRAARARWAKK